MFAHSQHAYCRCRFLHQYRINLTDLESRMMHKYRQLYLVNCPWPTVSLYKIRYCKWKTPDVFLLNYINGIRILWALFCKYFSCWPYLLNLQPIFKEDTPKIKLLVVFSFCLFSFSRSRQNDILFNSVDPLVCRSGSALIFEFFTFGLDANF